MLCKWSVCSSFDCCTLQRYNLDAPRQEILARVFCFAPGYALRCGHDLAHLSRSWLKFRKFQTSVPSLRFRVTGFWWSCVNFVSVCVHVEPWRNTDIFPHLTLLVVISSVSWSCSFSFSFFWFSFSFYFAFCLFKRRNFTQVYALDIVLRRDMSAFESWSTCPPFFCCAHAGSCSAAIPISLPAFVCCCFIRVKYSRPTSCLIIPTTPWQSGRIHSGQVTARLSQLTDETEAK